MIEYRGYTGIFEYDEEFEFFCYIAERRREIAL